MEEGGGAGEGRGRKGGKILKEKKGVGEEDDKT